MKTFISVTIIITVVFVFGTNCNAEVLKSNGTAGKELTAETLVSYGRESNNSLIAMIGRVIENYHVCTSWSKWSECGATLVDYFTTRTRTRRCGRKETRYGNHDEIERGVCEGRGGNKTKTSCPRSYHTTSKGFCLKFYKEKKSFFGAIAVCKDGGGYLVNIDSDQKYESVKAMLLAKGVTSQIRIDGKYVDSKWTFSYGSTDGYFHWYPSNPRSVPSHKWLKLSGNRSQVGNRFRTYSTDETTPEFFICEIPQHN